MMINKITPSVNHNYWFISSVIASLKQPLYDKKVPKVFKPTNDILITLGSRIIKSK